MIDEFKVICVMNQAMLKTLKDSNNNFDKNLKIQKCLEDKALFFKIDKTTAYELLENVGVRNESIEIVYNKLIAPNVFYELLNQGIIQLNDDSLIIKYDNYNPDNLFKN